MSRKTKTILLFVVLFLTLFTIIFLTAKGVKIGTPTPEKQYILENAEFKGIEQSSCYRSSCSATLKFQVGENTYLLNGGNHEIRTLVIGSYYDVKYDNYNKSIKNYDFAAQNSDVD